MKKMNRFVNNILAVLAGLYLPRLITIGLNLVGIDIGVGMVTVVFIGILLGVLFYLNSLEIKKWKKLHSDSVKMMRESNKKKDEIIDRQQELNIELLDEIYNLQVLLIDEMKDELDKEEVEPAFEDGTVRLTSGLIETLKEQDAIISVYEEVFNKMMKERNELDK